MASSHKRSHDPRLALYTVVRGVGRGSYGEVFLVKRRGEKKQYVMKNIKLSASTAKERLAAEQEASLLSQLQHPNIVSYRESFQDEFGILHIVMGYCEGGDLHSRLKARKGELLPESQVVEWFVQIALALQYLHDRNILHRDLKTQNIFLSRNDIIKVGDLGIARVLDGSCDLASTVIGTPYYMSPELFANTPYNHKSDIWALGCCVHEMATLKHAFTAQNINALMYKIIQGKVPPLPSQFSDELSSLVREMLSQDASKRPSSQQILRMDFIRRHIKLFLDRATSKKRKASHRTNGEASIDRCGEDEEAKRNRRRGSSDASSRDPSPAAHPRKKEESSAKHRSSSLTSLPQSKPGSRRCSPEGVRGQKPPTPRDKKLPRPLPPDPTRAGEERRKGGVETKPPASPAVSSARERRRRHKQDKGVAGKGRVVLRSRSSSDLQRKDKESSSGRGSDESEGSSNNSPHVCGRSGSKDETDGPTPLVNGCNEGMPPDTDETDGPTPLVHGSREGEPASGALENVNGFNEGATPGPVETCSASNEAPELANDCNEGVSSEDSNNEVDEFYTLLDSTLHLPEPPNPRPREEEGIPQARVAFDEALPSGRLADRIAVLRRECEQGVGEELMGKAFTVLDQLDPDFAEEGLAHLLGEKIFQNYASKLQQLKLCEESLYGQ